MQPRTNIQTETDEAYTELHQAIMSSELLPNQHLVELELAKRLGVEQATIRTALDRLAQDRLVERELIVARMCV